MDVVAVRREGGDEAGWSSLCWLLDDSEEKEARETLLAELERLLLCLTLFDFFFLFFLLGLCFFFDLFFLALVLVLAVVVAVVVVALCCSDRADSDRAEDEWEDLERLELWLSTERRRFLLLTFLLLLGLKLK